MPDVETLYPFGIDNATLVSVPALSDELCGLFRPGHFDGVSSVITRLFNLVQPDVAVFGQKDYQQQLVINRLVKDLNLPIKIICGETVREDDGLALSSKNRHLSEEERALAPKIHETLDEIEHELENGQRNFEVLETQAFEKLKSLGFTPEYVSIRRAENLDPPNRDCDELVVLVSAWLGKAHLIDNLVVHI
jgi:pantoate--beta-alanine ligase